jgi:hypothetical protein
VSNLIVSFEDSSNLCFLCIIFLGSYLYFIYVMFWSLCLFSRQAQVHHKQFSYEKVVAFSIWEVLHIRFFREVKPLVW